MYWQLQFDGLVVGNYLGERYGGASFLLMRPDADIIRFIDKINNNANTPSLTGPGQLTYSLASYTDSYFDGETVQPFESARSKLLVQVCGLVVVLLFFSAGFNFVTLLVVGLLHRKKEMIQLFSHYRQTKLIRAGFSLV